VVSRPARDEVDRDQGSDQQLARGDQRDHAELARVRVDRREHDHHEHLVDQRIEPAADVGRGLPALLHGARDGSIDGIGRRGERDERDGPADPAVRDHQTCRDGQAGQRQRVGEPHAVSMTEPACYGAVMKVTIRYCNG